LLEYVKGDKVSKVPEQTWQLCLRFDPRGIPWSEVETTYGVCGQVFDVLEDTIRSDGGTRKKGGDKYGPQSGDKTRTSLRS